MKNFRLRKLKLVYSRSQVVIACAQSHLLRQVDLMVQTTRLVQQFDYRPNVSRSAKEDEAKRVIPIGQNHQTRSTNLVLSNCLHVPTTRAVSSICKYRHCLYRIVPRTHYRMSQRLSDTSSRQKKRTRGFYMSRKVH